MRFNYIFKAIILSLFFGISSHAQDFSANLLEGCAPLQVKFTTSASGIYAWTFGKTFNNTSNIKEPEVIYDQPGTYTITLSVNGSSPIVKTAFIKVHSLPSVDFDFKYTIGCAPQDVKFINKSISTTDVPITSYQWIFGDGSDFITNVSESVNHTYSLSGNLFATLISKIETLPGCVNAKVSSVPIQVYDIEADFTAPTFFCSPPATVLFTNTSTGPGQLTYSWDFDGLATSAEASPTYSFSNTGDHLVKLTARGDFNCTASTSQIIQVGTNAFSIISDFDKICEGGELNLSVAFGEYLNSWAWNFGNDATPIFSLNQKVIYKNAGIYLVRFSGTIGNCSVSLTKSIEVLPFPVPSFTTSAKCNRAVKFNNTSTHSSEWLWDFGDGTTSTDESPTHTYSIAGEFNIKLIAKNQIGCSVEMTPTTIKVYENPIAAILPLEDPNCDKPFLTGCAPYTINFINNTDAGLPISSVSWDFGDGRKSSSSTPIITYSTPGTFIVKMTVNAVAGCSSTKQATVRILNPAQAILPNIVITDSDVCVGEEVTIKAEPSSSNFLCWEIEHDVWVSGNEFKYQWRTPGENTIKVKIPGCPNEKTFTKAISVREPGVDFHFLKHCRDSFNPNAASPFDVDFINISTFKSGLSYEWKFGDGTTSTDRNPPRHRFPVKPLESIDYPVTLSIKDPSTLCEVTVSQTINIHELKADFSVRGIDADNIDLAKAVKACKNNEISFTDKSLFALMWQWDFKDRSSNAGYSDKQNVLWSYTQAGSYDVSLSVTDGECTSNKTMAIPITIPDLEGRFSFTAKSNCEELEVQFTDLSISDPPAIEWLWSFGNGDFSPIQNPIYIYKKLGEYNASLTVGNGIGQCVVPLTNALAFTNPVADFTVNKNGACLEENISFNQTTLNTNSVRWDFGNGETSISFSPFVAYTNTGTYPVTLWAKDLYGCEIKYLKNDFITITKPTADFQFDKIVKDCPPLVTSFLDKSTDAIQWLWSFGDGQQADFKNPINTFRFPGTYSVSLSVKDINGCSDTKGISELVKVNGPSGVFQNKNTINCTNDPITFSSEYNNAVSVEWDFGDGFVERNDNAEVRHTYTITGSVQPLVSLTDDRGCKVVYTTAQQLLVNKSPQSDFNHLPEFPLEGEQVTFLASEHNYEFSWLFLDENIYDKDTVQKVFSDSGDKEVILQVKDPSSGCFSQVTKNVYVQGYPEFLPNVFTPNNDNWNDLFKIPGLEKSSWKFVVYNRWGNLVYKNDDYNNNWDGRNLSSGTYYYKLQNTYRSEIYFTGFVQIVH